ncbi:MAG: cardiolipin synthase [Phycisphaera sp.]|nr:cardiolipin synthase [Phycisphaera sp.]
MSWLTFFTLAEWGIRVVMIGVVLRRRLEPSTALAWLTIIFLQPTVGLVAYLFIGDNRLGRRRIIKYREAILPRRPDLGLDAWKSHIVRPLIAPSAMPVVRQAERITGMPILAGNDVELLGDTDNTIDRLIEDIDAAKHHVHMTYFIYRPDQTGQRVTEALVRARQRSVDCRLLVDAAGSRALLKHGQMVRTMRDAGIELHTAMPVAPFRQRFARIDLRNHRKLAVIDGTVGYTGSQNIVDADYGHKKAGQWIDLSGRFTGPIVGQLQSVFLEDWYFETDREPATEDIFPTLSSTGQMPAQTVPTGPAEDYETFHRVLLAAVNAAQRKLIITSPYLVPDHTTITALQLAAGRGVEVHLVLPDRSDKPVVDAAARAYFRSMLETGVHIHEYERGMLHAKTMTVDDDFALLGSSNLDIRSFRLNFEINVLLYGSQVVSELRFAQMRYIGDSHTVALDDWLRRPRWRDYTQGAAALLSPLL